MIHINLTTLHVDLVLSVFSKKLFKFPLKINKHVPHHGHRKGFFVMFESIMKETLPFIITILEIMGIFIITIGAFRAFYHYMKTLLVKDHYPVKHQFANSMATGLEFKLAAEILKTVLIQSLSELIILGSIFLLRVLMTIVIQWEMREDAKNADHGQSHSKLKS